MKIIEIDSGGAPVGEKERVNEIKRNRKEIMARDERLNFLLLHKFFSLLDNLHHKSFVEGEKEQKRDRIDKENKRRKDRKLLQFSFQFILMAV